MRYRLIDKSPEALEKIEFHSFRIHPIPNTIAGVDIVIGKIDLRIDTPKGPRNPKGDELVALHYIVANGMLAFRNASQYVEYSTQSDRLFRDLGFNNRRAFIRVLDALEARQLINLYEGCLRGSKKIPSRFEPTRSFYALCKYQHILGFTWDSEMYVEFKDRETGKMLDNVHYPDAIRNSEILRRTNELINTGRVRRGDIGFNHITPFTEYKQLLHVNADGSFTGGRIYGRIGYLQNMSQHHRLTYLTIDGEEVTELDFVGTAPNSIRELVNDIKRDDYDPYKCRLPRPLAKQAYLIMINNSDQLTALQALNSLLVEYRQKVADGQEKWRDLAELDYDPVASFEEARSIFAELLENSPYLSEYVFNDWGMKLQMIDSKIALDVLDHFQTLGEVCIPYHDSFLVKASMKDQLKSAMRKAWRRHLGGDTHCGISEKKRGDAFDKGSQYPDFVTAFQLERNTVYADF